MFQSPPCLATGCNRVDVPGVQQEYPVSIPTLPCDRVQPHTGLSMVRQELFQSPPCLATGCNGIMGRTKRRRRMVSIPTLPCDRVQPGVAHRDDDPPGVSIPTL